MDPHNQPELLVAPTASNMIPMPVAGLREMETASRDGADSGIDIRPAAVQRRQGDGLPEQPGESPRLPPAPGNRNMSRTSWAQQPERVVTSSSLMGRYSSELPSPQKFIRLSTVSARNSLRHQRPFHSQPYDEHPEQRNAISWYEATESRPPLRIDMSGPTPTTYSPSNKPLYETNAPAYSFGRKEPDKRGSGQKAWGKLWFRSHSPFTFKTNYELHWPSPFHYHHKSTLGPKQVNKPAFPSHSMGARQPEVIRKKKKEIQPVPTIYYPEVLALSRMRRAPAHSMGCKLPDRNWTPILDVPAPNAYNPLQSIFVTKPSKPSFTMCPERRNKRHDVGPFVTL